MLSGCITWLGLAGSWLLAGSLWFTDRCYCVCQQTSGREARGALGWLEFALAWAAFFATHSLPLRPPVRLWLRARLGTRGFTLAYSALSLAALVWLIGAAGRAPFVTLWNWAAWQVHVPLVLMLPVCLIVALAVGRPNPF